MTTVKPKHQKLTPKTFFLVNEVKDGLPPPPVGYVTVDAGPKVSRWIQEQADDTWLYGRVPAYSYLFDRYFVKETLYTAMLLRWS